MLFPLPGTSFHSTAPPPANICLPSLSVGTFPPLGSCPWHPLLSILPQLMWWVHLSHVRASASCLALGLIPESCTTSLSWVLQVPSPWLDSEDTEVNVPCSWAQRISPWEQEAGPGQTRWCVGQGKHKRSGKTGWLSLRGWRRVPWRKKCWIRVLRSQQDLWGQKGRRKWVPS